MAEKTLNSLIVTFLLITIGGFFIITKNLITNEVAMKYFGYIYTIPFSLTPLLLISKVVSSIFLIGLKDQPVSSLEKLYFFYYLLLTKEARKEWTGYIKEQKRKSA
jgi:hypothetical protein